MKKLTIVALSAITLAMLNATGAEAQGSGPGRGMRARGTANHNQMMGGPGAGGTFSPGLLLRQEQALELNEDQIAALTELRDGLEGVGRQARDARQERQARMRELMNADSPDIDAVHDEFVQTHAAMGEVQWARMEAGLRARALLTDEQRGQVRGMMQAGTRMRHGAARRGVSMRQGRQGRGMRRMRP